MPFGALFESPLLVSDMAGDVRERWKATQVRLPVAFTEGMPGMYTNLVKSPGDSEQISRYRQRSSHGE